jgi:putative transport protein
MGPRLMRVNLREEAEKLQAQLGSADDDEAGVRSAFTSISARAYRVANGRFINRTVGELETAPREFRAFISRIRRAGAIIDARPETVIEKDDIAVVVTRTEILMARGTEIGPEVDDKELLDFPVEILDVVVTSKAVVGKTIRELAAGAEARGVFLRKLTRVGQSLPFTADTRLDRGDTLTLVGALADVERAARAIGYAERPTVTTDMIFVGTGIVLGGLVGLLSVTVAGMPLTLTASGGALVGGLVFGWLRAVYPTFGRIPEPAMWVFDTVGLTVFMAAVGLSAGPSFVSGLRTTGISLVAVGLLVAVIPHLTAILFGRYVLRMNPVILLGACAGAGTITAALRAIQEEAQSKLPAIGYTVPYAVGNILLTAWGPVIVALMR